MRLIALSLLLVSLPATVQADDRGYLTAFLEDNLSGAGRQVVITGFEGALSSKAKIAELTIADDQGVWLRLTDVVLDWNRAALLSGAVSVNQLSAGEIVLERLPTTPEAAPSPEATEFALPELPVSVQIGRLAADSIRLGPTVLGQPVEGRLEAALSLSGGEGAADLTLERLDDGPDGRIALSASYSNSRQSLALDLTADEGAGGLAVTSLGVPGAPAARLEIQGEGPFRDFSAKVNLATDGQSRLSGTVTVLAQDDQRTGFAVDLQGDLAPLFLPDYAAFFGDSIALQAQGESHADGRLALKDFTLRAKAIDLGGTLTLDSNGHPTAFNLSGQIAAPDGSPVLLPLGSEMPTRVMRAEIGLQYDARQDDGWQGNARITGLDRADFRASQVELSGSGRIRPGQIGATLLFNAEGLEPTDIAVSQALGPFVSGEALIYSLPEGGLALPRLTFSGQDYRLSATGLRLQGLADGFRTTGRVLVELEDLARLSLLANQTLSGAATLDLSGSLTPVSGAFDAKLVARGTDMAIGQAEIDALLRGEALVTAKMRRDTTGSHLDALTVAGPSLAAQAQGRIASAGNDLTATVELGDLTVLGQGYAGAFNGRLHLTGTATAPALRIEGDAKDLRIGQTEVDRLLAGQSRLDVQLRGLDGRLQVTAASLTNPQLATTATGTLAEGTQRLDIKGRLANLDLLLPEFPGPVTLGGTVGQDAQGFTLDLKGQGPGGIDATARGRVSADLSFADLSVQGRAQAGLANAFLGPRNISGTADFDLRLSGPLALQSISGTLGLTGGRLADPSLPFALQDVTARADLSGGQARVEASLPVSTGGKAAVSGTVGLAEPYNAALGLALQSVVLRDPDLYETQIDGALKITGGLTGGALIAGNVRLGETELRVPSTGFGGAGGLPDLRHVREPSDVRATRARAGLIGKGAGPSGSGGGRPFALDVTIAAPNRVFLRGRGLDAEMGGEFRIAGTTDNVQPMGGLTLVRGRLDILGKRLTLDEAELRMEGQLLPYLLVSATTENDGIVSGVRIEGPANDPKVSFTSMPELPEEEVLAQLLFGQDLQNLSALQALQLANAVATLAGRGGAGVVGRLRQGFGLDDLDVKTTASGGTEVTAGKYLGKNLYSEVTVDQEGKTRIELNLDIAPGITFGGRAGSDGDTGVGFYLEKDY